MIPHFVSLPPKGCGSQWAHAGHRTSCQELFTDDSDKPGRPHTGGIRHQCSPSRWSASTQTAREMLGMHTRMAPAALEHTHTHTHTHTTPMRGEAAGRYGGPRRGCVSTVDQAIKVAFERQASLSGSPSGCRGSAETAPCQRVTDLVDLGGKGLHQRGLLLLLGLGLTHLLIAVLLVAGVLARLRLQLRDPPTLVSETTSEGRASPRCPQHTRVMSSALPMSRNPGGAFGAAAKRARSS